VRMSTGRGTDVYISYVVLTLWQFLLCEVYKSGLYQILTA
jgi:hypothetical protein